MKNVLDIIYISSVFVGFLSFLSVLSSQFVKHNCDLLFIIVIVGNQKLFASMKGTLIFQNTVNLLLIHPAVFEENTIIFMC